MGGRMGAGELSNDDFASWRLTLQQLQHRLLVHIGLRQH
jgi:hypothetical protein